MKIRLVQYRHGEKRVLAELYNAADNELPEVDETIRVAGSERRVLSVVKSYEKECVPSACWFEVDVT